MGNANRKKPKGKKLEPKLVLVQKEKAKATGRPGGLSTVDSSATSQ